MNRKSMVWLLLPALTVLFLGCPKKQPAPPAPEIQMETREEPAPPPPRPPAPQVDEQEVDPLDSDDLRLVNEELVRRGFVPNIYFDFDKSDLRPEAITALATDADFLKSHPEFLLTIEGHCDERGTNEYNLALGERRANTVKSYLASLGVSGERLKTISYGEERPVCSESDEACWQRNRRGHLLVTGRAR